LFARELLVRLEFVDQDRHEQRQARQLLDHPGRDWARVEQERVEDQLRLARADLERSRELLNRSLATLQLGWARLPNDQATIDHEVAASQAQIDIDEGKSKR
jgi:uncharacterized caspase-like protein